MRVTDLALLSLLVQEPTPQDPLSLDLPPHLRVLPVVVVEGAVLLIALLVALVVLVLAVGERPR